jgi:sulfonate transport system permease protein
MAQPAPAQTGVNSGSDSPPARISLPQSLQGLLLPAALLVLWELVAQVELVSNFLLPPLSEVLVAMGDMAADGTLFTHVGASLLRVLSGFLIGALIGGALGIAVGLSVKTERFIDPTLQALRSIPALAWVPLLLLWMGIDESPKVTLVAIGAFFPVYLNLMAGIRGVDRKLIEVGRIYGFSQSELVRRIVLPASLPSVLTGLRTGLAVAWLYVVAAELIAAHSGLGFMLSDGRELSRGDLIFSSIILLAICGKATDGLLKTVETRLLSWRDTVVQTSEEGRVANG